MLIVAEGTVHRRVDGAVRDATLAWLDPMANDGFLHSAYVDAVGRRVWMVLSAPDHLDVVRRLGDLPIVRDGYLSFTTTTVTPVRLP
jgi:hypothetical protein